MYKTRTTCRICGGDLTTVLDLGEIYVSSFLDIDSAAIPKVPIELTECNECHLMQLRHTVRGDIMYGAYWYKSGLNPWMVDALKDVVLETLKRVKEVTQDDIVVDIGANDGTLFRQYPDIIKSQVKLVGFEPSNLGSLARDACNILIDDYFSAKLYNLFVNKPAKIITSIAMFYDLDDPHSFIEDVKSVLHEDGVWTIQIMDLVSMLKTNDFPNLCHEHLEYYSLAILCDLLSKHGLEVFDAEYNAVNGSSLRIYVAHASKYPISHIVRALAEDEMNYLMSLGNPANHFKQAIENVKVKVVDYIRALHNDNKVIAVLGASTKGNTILQYLGLDNTVIEHAAEINPDKYGKYTVGSNIIIIPQENSLALNPDYYLILPWGFLNTFLRKFDGYLKNGGKFIVPLPEPKLIYYKDNQLHSEEL